MLASSPGSRKRQSLVPIYTSSLEQWPSTNLNLFLHCLRSSYTYFIPSTSREPANQNQDALHQRPHHQRQFIPR